jgi:hypothetical protein
MGFNTVVTVFVAEAAVTLVSPFDEFEICDDNDNDTTSGSTKTLFISNFNVTPKDDESTFGLINIVSVETISCVFTYGDGTFVGSFDKTVQNFEFTIFFGFIICVGATLSGAVEDFVAAVAVLTDSGCLVDSLKWENDS